MIFKTRLVFFNHKSAIFSYYLKLPNLKNFFIYLFQFSLWPTSLDDALPSPILYTGLSSALVKRTIDAGTVTTTIVALFFSLIFVIRRDSWINSPRDPITICGHSFPLTAELVVEESHLRYRILSLFKKAHFDFDICLKM